MGDQNVSARGIYLPATHLLQGWPSFLPPVETPDALDHVWMRPWVRTVAEGDTTALSSVLLIEQDIAFAVPGFDAVSLRVAPAEGGGTAVPFTLQGAPELQARIDGLPVVLRVRSDYLRPTVDVSDDDEPARFAPDPDREHLDIPLADIDVIAGTDGFDIQVGQGTSLPLCLIGDTGIAVEADGIEFHFDPDDPPPGKPAGWCGIAISSATVHLPGGLAEATGQLTLQDAFIGNGGLSGTVAASWTPALSTELFGVAVELDEVALEFRQNTLVASDIHGRLQLPFFDEPLDVEVTINLDGSLGVRVDDDEGQATVTVDDVLDLTVSSVGFVVEEGLLVAIVSGEVTPLVMSDQLDWPTFSIDELTIDSDGNVHLDGGWLDLPEQHVLDFHGFQIEIAELGFGGTDDGGRWVGFSGGINLVEGLQAGASVDGLRVAWYDDGGVSVTLDGIGVEFEIPGVLSFKGEVGYREENGAHLFAGAIAVELQALEMTIDGRLVVGRDADGETFLGIFVDVGLPAGIPLFATSLSLYGFSGLVAVGMEPNRGADEGWFGTPDDPGWYLRQPVGVTDLGEKWDPVSGSFALGAGVTVGTTPDNGYAFNGSLLLVIVFPGPIILLEGRGDLLKDRTEGGADSDALFRALAVLDNRAGTFTVGLDGGYRFADGGQLIDISANAEAFFDFADASAWYLNLGEDAPPERRVQARMYNLFQASGYVMLDPRRLAMGARFEIDEHWNFGPASLGLSAYAGGDVEVSFKPAHFHGRLSFGGSIDISLFRFGFLIALDAELAADVFSPMHIRGDLSIVLELPWPFSDWERDISFEWGPRPDPPPLPLPVKDVAVEHFKATTTWPLPRGSLLAPDLDAGGGYLRGDFEDADHTAPPPSQIPVVPLDARPRITFGRAVHDDARVGVNPQDVLPDAVPEQGYEWVGDPVANTGEVRVRYGLAALTLERQNAAGGWDTVADTSSSGGTEKLYGSWAPMPELGTGEPAPGTDPPAANTKLWLWSKTPFDHTRHGGRAWDDWFVDGRPSYPCLPERHHRVLHCDFSALDHGAILRSPWECPDHGVVVSWNGPEVLPLRMQVGRRMDPAGPLMLCLPAEYQGLRDTWEPNGVQIGLPQRASRVRILRHADHPWAHVRAFDGDGAVVFDEARQWTEPSIDVDADGLETVSVTWREGTLCLLGVDVSLEPDHGHVELRQEMVQHLANETARWSDEGYVLRPDSTYRLKIETTVQTKDWAHGGGFNAVRQPTEYAYFRTQGPPGLVDLSVPESPGSGSVDDFDSGLDDLSRYVSQTVPATVPAKGEQPRRPRPVYRAYDVGILFNADYVDLLYRMAGRPLRLYLFDDNGRPARDAEGRLLITTNRWGTTETRRLEDSESRWVELIDASDCVTIDEAAFTGETRVSTAAAGGGLVLDAETLYEARLAPLLFGEDFSDGLARWAVVDDASDSSSWQTRDATDLDDAPAGVVVHGVVEQTSAIGDGPTDPADPAKPGTMLLTPGDGWTDYRFSALARSSAGRAIGVVVRHSSDGCYRFSMDAAGGYRRLVKIVGGGHTVLAEDAGTYDTDRDYRVTVEAFGPLLRVLIDGRLLFEVVDDDLPQGRAGLYCWADDGARFADVTVDDLSSAQPVVSRFSFATSRFANFFHQMHGFDDRAWDAAIPGDVAAEDIAGLWAHASDPGHDVTDDETRAYSGLADLITGGVPVQPPDRVEATWIHHDGAVVGLWLVSPEPIDWSRTSLEVTGAADRLAADHAPGAVKLTGASLGAEPDEQSVDLLLRKAVDLTGWAVETPRAPGALADPEHPPAAVLDASQDGELATVDDDLLWAEDFSLPGFDGWRFVDEPPYTVRASDWVVEDGELRERTNLYGFVDAPYGQPGTYGVAGDAVWTDYALHVRLRSDEPAAIGVLFRFRDDDHYYRFSMNAGDGERRLTRKFGGTTKLLWEDVGPVAVGEWSELEIRCDGPRITVVLDGETLVDVVEDAPEAMAAGRVGVYCRANTGARFDRLTVTDLRPVQAQPRLAVSDADHADVLCRTTMPHTDADPVKVLLRRTGTRDFHRFSVIPRTGAAALVRRSGDRYTPLWKGDLSWAPAGAEIVVAAEGRTLRGFLDGVPVFTVHDDRLAASGLVGIAGGDAPLELFPHTDAHRDWLLADDFADGGLDRWTLVDEGARDAPSNWEVADGWLHQTSNIHGHAGGTEHRPGTYALAGEADWADYRLSVRVRSHDDDAIGVMVRYRDPDNYYRFAMDAERRYRQLIRKVDGEVTVLWQDDVAYTVDHEYVVSVTCVGSRISGHLDGHPLFAVTDDELPAGRIGLYCWANDDTRFAEVRVTEPSWIPAYRFAGEERLPAGTRVRVHGGSEADAPEPPLGLLARFAGAGSGGLGPTGASVRLTSPDGRTEHERRFAGEAAFAPVGDEILRSADGTGLFVLPAAPVAGSCRLTFAYRRDNTAAEPDSLVLSQAGDTGPEHVSIVVPGPG